MLEKLMDSPIAWTVLAILAIASFIYAIYCQHKNKEKKEFSYIQKSNSLIRKKKSKFEKLNITYNNQAVEDLCVSRFTIWNSGNKTINNIDIVETKEITISTLDDNQILDVELIACSEETNRFKIEKANEHTIKILFDYVDKKEGIVLQIIHTGTSDSLKIDCKIKGGNPIKNIVNDSVPKLISTIMNREDFEKTIMFATCIAIAFLLIVATIYTIAIFNTELQHILFAPKEANGTQPFEPKNTAIIMSIVFWVYDLLISALFIPTFKKKFDIGIPKALKRHSSFED